MLGKVFQRFVENSPISVMVRGTLERVLGAEQLDAWYERTAQKQYTRDLLFSTVYDLLSQVVFRIKPSVHAAYRAHEDTVGTSIVSVYNKLNGVETHTSAELVRYSATVLAPLVAQVGGACDPWVAGYRVKIIDGNCIAASERRLQALRAVQAGALPGKALVVFAPAQGLVTDVFPCNWLQVLGTTETPQIDQGVRHQFHPVVALLDVLETQQQPLEFVLPRKRPLDTLP